MNRTPNRPWVTQSAKLGIHPSGLNMRKTFTEEWGKQIKEGISNFNNLREHSLWAFVRINSLFSKYSPINNQHAQTSLFADSSNAAQKEEKEQSPLFCSLCVFQGTVIFLSPLLNLACIQVGLLYVQCFFFCACVFLWTYAASSERSGHLMD